jgi:hypothetical protein
MHGQHRRSNASVLNSSLLIVSVAVAGLAAAGCGTSKAVVGTPESASEVPSTPMPVPGHAAVSGLVRDGEGHGVAGATIRLAETDASATTDGSGAYAFMAPSDWTLTFVTTAAGFATSYRESIVLAEGAVAQGFDVTLLRPGDIARLGGLGGADPAAMLGLVAVRLHSLTPSCLRAGARVSVWPPLAGKIVYGRPSATGGLDEPDPSLTSVQDGARVDAWLVGAVPPGNMLRITVDQAGCAAAAEAPSMDGLSLTGGWRVDAQALTETDLFLR